MDFNFHSSSPSVAFKPLNPPPFTLSNVQAHDVSSSSSRSTPTLPCYGVTVITPNETQSCTITSSAAESAEERRKKENNSNGIIGQTTPRPNATPNANDTHDAAVLLASIRNLVVEKEAIAPISFMPKIPQLEKHFKRDDDKKNSNSNYNIQQESNLGFSSSSSSPFLTSTHVNYRARTVSMDVHTLPSNVNVTVSSHPLRKPLLGGGMEMEMETGLTIGSGLPAYISPPQSPSLRPLPAPGTATLTGTRKPMTMTATIHRRVADRRKRYLEECTSSFDTTDDESDDSSDNEELLVKNSSSSSSPSPRPVSRPPASKKLKSSPSNPRPSPKSPTRKVKPTNSHSSKSNMINEKILKNHHQGSSSSRTDTDNDTSTNTPKAILRKKFSWKNFPELESFLIENREEYLRHSALNYTMQQKQYNNRLTERLIDLATNCGYAFDPDSFTFVTIRDRIRCYFKSYVQSRKKRGVIIGYAARKAGLLGVKELEKKASSGTGTGTGTTGSPLKAGKRRR